MALPILHLPNGLHLQLDSQDRLGDCNYIAGEIFRTHSYQRPGFELRPTDTVVDVGAHTGLFALWAAPQVPEGRVICIEPTRSIECLAQSLASNNLQNVRILRCAIGQPGTHLEIIDSPAFGALNRSTAFRLPLVTQMMVRWFGGSKVSNQVTTTAPCRSLEDIIQSETLPRINFLKIDCEGAEYSIFDHISPSLLEKVERIAMEFHEFHPSHDHRCLVRQLESAGFEVQIQKRWLKYHLYKVGALWAHR